MTISGAAMVAGVTGWPVSHSLSPMLHNRWIASAELDAVYIPFPIQPESAAAALRALGSIGVRGVNVTTPHKEVAIAIADDVTDAARAVGAANVLTFSDGHVTADNTDVPGFLAGLTEAGVSHIDKALVLGAGGAARAAIFALLGAGVDHITVVNRTPEEGLRVAEQLSAGSGRVTSAPWAEREQRAEDASLIVNATTAGMAGRSPLAFDMSAARSDAIAYDLVYTPLETPFLADARERGMKTVEGLDMLIGQARPSFEAFFNAETPTDVDVRSLLIDALGAKA